MLSLYFYGFIVFARLGIQQQRDEGKNGYRALTWVSIVVSVFMHWEFFKLSLEVNKPYMII